MDDNDFWIVKAKFRLRCTEEGGRRTGIISGYRPNHVFKYKDNKFVAAYMGDIRFSEHEIIKPGEEKIVTVRFIHGQPIKHYLTVGRQWWIHEGPNLVGEAYIVEVYKI
jgi:translation elongation factor EF-Tu-like GTPase